ncbi:MAG: alpha/beta hydrolase [Rhodopirellula sp.]|nr:alpha/beta hydrolase [Rhodopirellula sp.]
MVISRAIIFAISVLLYCDSCIAQETRPVAGEPTLETVEHGKYWRYLPKTVTPKSHVLVICHGMLTEEHTGVTSAIGFLKVWIEFANATSAVLVAPAFEDETFGAGTGCPHGWGYRGLYGRHIGADEFLHEIIDALKGLNPEYDGKFYMFGHSAGGQFASHYVVKHPSRVHTAAISAPAWLPFPTMEDNWPRGLKPRRSIRRWPGETEDQDVLVTPDPQAFIAAAELPLLITSGALDLEPLHHNASQQGDTHVARAQSWAKAMNQYAVENERKGAITCVIVPNVGHSGGTMARSTMPFLAKHMARNKPPRARK